MTVSEFPVQEKETKVVSALYLNELSRTVVAVAQMVADGCIVAISSFFSLSFAILMHLHDHIDVYLYIPPTVAATIGLVLGLARSGCYDVFNTLGRLGAVLRS